MKRKQRHAVLVLPRPAEWQPQSATDLPTPLVHIANVDSSEAADAATLFNEIELAEPSGRWAVVVKDRRSKKQREPEPDCIAFPIALTQIAARRQGGGA
jgi:hypothetical protein